MNYTITPTPEFIRQAKMLAKKNRRMGDDLVKLKEVLIENPHAGTAIGNNCFKLRIGNSSNSKGKSSGYRVITYCLDENKIIRLLLIYAKNERESVSDMEIIEVLKNNALM